MSTAVPSSSHQLASARKLAAVCELETPGNWGIGQLCRTELLSFLKAAFLQLLLPFLLSTRAWFLRGCLQTSTMDVHRAADLEQYTQLISRQQGILRKAKARRGQRPRDRKSRQDAYSEFMLALLLKGGQREGTHMIHSSFIPPSYPPCIVPLAELRQVTIKDLQLEIHHRGTYIVLRSITPPRRMTAIMALMEDQMEDAVLLQLYQQEDENSRKAADIVDVGTILLVKEPYFKVMADGEYGVRVDHISDVVRLEDGNDMIPDKWRLHLNETTSTAESLKLRGNAAVGEHKYREAITEYVVSSEEIR